jgi:predicted enzyme related to lactoylglutathione lyase
MSHSPHHAAVWFELPVRDLDKAIGFYNTVLGYDLKIDTNGPNPMAFFPHEKGSVGGHLYPGTPSPDAGPTVHLIVPDTLEDATQRCWDAGGQVLPGDPIPVPDGRFSYAKDPDGNSIGLFQMNAG